MIVYPGPNVAENKDDAEEIKLVHENEKTLSASCGGIVKRALPRSHLHR